MHTEVRVGLGVGLRIWDKPLDLVGSTAAGYSAIKPAAYNSGKKRQDTE